MTKKERKQRIISQALEAKTFGSNLNFAASEAYKLLRANLMFAMPGVERCRVIGITSSTSGEGKSTTSLNLAYMLAEAGKKTLLLEADMRLPTVAQKLGVNPAPGLSNVLAGMGDQVIQDSGIQPMLQVVTAGDIPPNPSELLGSEKLQVVLEVLSQSFDFIIIDLPPVIEVSDALLVSRATDGILFVVCQEYASRSSVDEAMRELKYAEAKVIGFVVTSTHGVKKNGRFGKYGKYNKYGKYGKYGKYSGSGGSQKKTEKPWKNIKAAKNEKN